MTEDKLIKYALGLERWYHKYAAVFGGSQRSIGSIDWELRPWQT